MNPVRPRRALVPSIVIAFMIGASPSAPAPARPGGVIHVNVALGSGLNNGTSWMDAFRGPDALQIALAAAQPGDEIWVAQGEYRPSSTGDRGVSFTLFDDREMYGGFDGTETLREQRNWAVNPTVIHGDVAGDEAFVGAPGDDGVLNLTPDSGAVYAYRRDVWMHAGV